MKHFLPPGHPAINASRLAGGWVAGGVLLLAGCAGEQSALDPAGKAARQIAGLFWWMAGGTVVVWMWLASRLSRGSPEEVV